MSIKFNCPHCQKPLNVKDHLAGKRAGCPGCKKVLTVPAPTAQPANLEEFAATALADVPEPVAAVPEAKFVEFVCAYCDAKVQVNAELAGKQAPCPECRHIVKVPQLEKKGPKDWRKIDNRLPSGARQNLEQPAPEGTWGTHSAGVVSREALVEAEAIPQARERITVKQWIKRGSLVAGVLLLGGLATLLVLKTQSQNKQSLAINNALQILEAKNKVSPEAAGALHCLAGEYYYRAQDAREASNHFNKGRNAVLTVDQAHAYERDFVLRDLLVNLPDLGGEKSEVDNKSHIRWEDSQKQLQQTWQHLRNPELRAETLRVLVRKLNAKNKVLQTVALAKVFGEEAAELIAVIGLELWQAKDIKGAESMAAAAQQAIASPVPKKPAEDKSQAGMPAPSLIALWLVLGKPDKAAALAAPPIEGKPSNPASMLGYADGWTRLGRWEEARKQFLRKDLLPQNRLPVLVAAAVTADEIEPRGSAVQAALTDAFGLLDSDLKGQPIPSWTLFQLVRLCARNGQSAKAEPLAKAIADSSLRGRAQLEILRARLGSAAVPDELATVVDKDSPAYGLALELVSRQNTHYGNAETVQTAIDGWEAEKLRPFGYLGVALGLQDKNP